MEKNNSFREIWEKLKNSRKVLLSLHYGPDGDSLGSCAAMKYFLERNFGAEVTIVSKDELDSILKDIDYSSEVVFGKGVDECELEYFDLVVLLDSGALKQFSGRKKDFVFPKESFVINIDHHSTNSYFGNLNYVEHRPSCCSVLLDFFRAMNVTIDSELATRILLGIYTDSGYFTHDNGASIKDAAFLIERGANYLDEIVNKIRYNYPLRLKKYYGLLYEKFIITEIEGYKIGHSSVSRVEIEKLGLNLSEVRGGINDLQEIGGVDILFTLVEVDGKLKGSFRTRKNIDVSLFAQALGGGGHKAAAAFFLENIPLKDAEKRVLEKIREVGIHPAR